ncbi:MAG TPA: hypothetical protein P5511_02190, partial [Candidatus Goldiibacteriota bacterium]|nr:hypothetical protein [Candidatus Goldiibacteriota bacterium]
MIFIIAALALNACDAVKKASRETEPAERVFNAANEAMTRGDNAAAIDLYYKILEKYPDFKQYRADSLYRLGVLLFRSERFEESEKILGIFIIKYKNHEKIKDAYEKLLYIYTREKKDPAKALKIREIYEKKYGKSGAVEIADRSEKILSGPLSGSYGS